MQETKFFNLGDEHPNRVVEPIRDLLLDVAKKFNLQRLFIAGSSALPSVPYRDIDVFFDRRASFDHKADLSDWKDFIIYTTRNAVSLRFNGKVVQLCKYYKSSLEELLLSFDFAHIQAGFEVKFDKGVITAGDLLVTYDCMLAHFKKTTWYTGSEYPLSSLLRLFKYAKRLNLPSKVIRLEAIKIVTDIMTRGFYSYEDLKDQLDAVDLLLKNLPQEVMDKLISCLKEKEE